MAKTIIYRRLISNGKAIRVVRGRSRKDTNEVKILVGGRQIGRVVYEAGIENPFFVELFDGVEVIT